MTRAEITKLPPGPKRLGAYLEARGLTLDAFAAKVRLANAGSVWKYIHGRRVPRPRTMAAIVRETRGAIQPADFYPAEAE